MPKPNKIIQYIVTGDFQLLWKEYFIGLSGILLYHPKGMSAQAGEKLYMPDALIRDREYEHQDYQRVREPWSSEKHRYYKGKKRNWCAFTTPDERRIILPVREVKHA